MPAMLEDPARPPIYRTSGAPPYPTPNSSEIPSTITPRQVTLRDRITIATLLPFSTATTVPPRLLSYLCQQFNLEIEKGDTYPMITTMSLETFAGYWFQNFGAIMILGAIEGDGYVQEVWRMEEQGAKWEECALGSFYVKPNYPGRSSHVCNGGFLVTEAARNKGVGRLMGEGYLEWAPRLGYTYSVFNLVYETNVASCRIWDALGFKRIGRIKGCGNLRSSPDSLVDAIIYGRDLGPEGEDYVSEERFDKIRFYLKHGKYPNGADRAEKSRLRSAATHYKLLPPEEGREGEEDAERLMLRDKEVVSDPQRQYEIARQVHIQGQHGGINKTTATIAEKYHWVRIKETVSLVIKNCENCKDSAPKAPTQSQSHPKHMETNPSTGPTPAMMDRLISFDSRPLTTAAAAQQQQQQQQQQHRGGHHHHHAHQQSETRNHANTGSPDASEQSQTPVSMGRAPMAHMAFGDLSQYSGIPLDPQIMQSSQQHQQQQLHYQQRQQQQIMQQAHPFSPNPPPPHAFPPSDHQHQRYQSTPTHAASHAIPHKLSDGADPAPQVQRYGKSAGRGVSTAGGPDDASAAAALQRQLEMAAYHPNNPPATAAANSGGRRPNSRSTRSSAAKSGTTSSAGGKNSKGGAAAAAAATAASTAPTQGPPRSSVSSRLSASGGGGGGSSGGGPTDREDADAHFDIDMTDAALPSQHAPGAGPSSSSSQQTGGVQGEPDGAMALASDRHIEMGDEPMGTR